jgi:hypothetical protein
MSEIILPSIHLEENNKTLENTNLIELFASDADWGIVVDDGVTLLFVFDDADV